MRWTGQGQFCSRGHHHPVLQERNATHMEWRYCSTKKQPVHLLVDTASALPDYRHDKSRFQSYRYTHPQIRLMKMKKKNSAASYKTPWMRFQLTTPDSSWVTSMPKLSTKEEGLILSWDYGEQQERQVTIGSRPSDHHFRSSVCLSVCLFVCLCRVFLSRLWSDFDQTRTHVTCRGLIVSPRI